MQKKSPTELERAKLLKASRTLIRLKHSLAADEEINALLPDTLEAFDAAVAKGEQKRLTSNVVAELGIL